MYRALSRRMRDERGIALITATLVSMVVMFLGITAVSIAVHNSEQSARNRRRVQSIGSAEAGLNYYMSQLQNAEPAEIQCQMQQPLTGTPTASFHAWGQFFDETGAPVACPMADDTIPDSVLITSQGETSGVNPTRTMQSYVFLVPKPPKAFGQSAIFSDGDPGMNSSVNVYDAGAVNADLYSNGNIRLNSNAVIHGGVNAQGWIEMNGNSEIKRDAHAGNQVVMTSTSVVRGNVTSSTSYISLSNGPHVYGDAKSGTTITAGAGQIDGLRVQNTPSDPPAHRPFPTYTYDAQDWIDEGYTTTTFSDCASAKSFISGITGGDHAVRITDGNCKLSWSGSDSVVVRGNLAIISDGSLNMESKAKFASDGSPHTLHLMFGLDKTPECNIEFHANADIDDQLDSLLYTPCEIIMNSKSFVANGQMFGGKVTFNASTSLTFKKIPIPGLAPEGFNENISYIREVVTSAVTPPPPA